MTARQVPVVVAGDADSLNDLIARLREVGRDGAPIDLAVPDDSSLLLTAAEFRVLGDAIARDRLGVVLRSEDPLRRQLAALLGVPAGPVPSHVASLLERQAVDRRGAPTRPRAAGGGAGDVADSGPLELRPSAPNAGVAGPPAPGLAATEKTRPAGEPDRRTPARAGWPAHPAGQSPSVGTVQPPARGQPRPMLVPSRDGGDVADAAAPEVSSTDAALPPGVPSQHGRPFGRRLASPVPVAGAAEPPNLEPNGPSVGGQTAPLPTRSAETGRGATIAEVVDRRRRRLPRWVGFAIGAAVLLALAAAAVAVLSPRATVALTLQQAPVRGEVRFAILVDPAAAVEPGTIALPASPVAVNVRAERTIPTTGVRREPDAVAVARVLFANPNPEPVTVDAGTELDTIGDVPFRLEAAVEVPAADPAAGAGRAAGTARAVRGGSDGNVAIGEIGGRLPSGVYYSNREGAATGGTDKETRIVTAADRAALAAAVDAALREAALAQLTATPAAGSRPVPATLQLEGKTETYSAAEGEVANSLTLTAVATARALTYDPAAALASVDDRIAEALGDAVPAGWVVDPAVVRFGEPVVEAEDAGGVRLRVPVEAVATPPFSDAAARALAERLAGAAPADAEAIIAETPGLAGWTVAYAPSWLPERMPSDPDRIAVEIRR